MSWEDFAKVLRATVRNNYERVESEMKDNAETRRNDLGAVPASCDLSCSKSSTPLLHSDEMREALKAVLADIADYERVNNLAPNAGRKYCWDSVARAHEALASTPQTPATYTEVCKNENCPRGGTPVEIMIPQTPWRDIREHTFEQRQKRLREILANLDPPMPQCQRDYLDCAILTDPLFSALGDGE